MQICPQQHIYITFWSFWSFSILTLFPLKPRAAWRWNTGTSCTPWAAAWLLGHLLSFSIPCLFPSCINMQTGKPRATALVQKAGYQVNTSPCSEGLEPLEWGGLWGSLYKPEVSTFIQLCPPVATVIFCVCKMGTRPPLSHSSWGVFE